MGITRRYAFSVFKIFLASHRCLDGDLQGGNPVDSPQAHYRKFNQVEPTKITRWITAYQLLNNPTTDFPGTAVTFRSIFFTICFCTYQNQANTSFYIVTVRTGKELVYHARFSDNRYVFAPVFITNSVLVHGWKLSIYTNSYCVPEVSELRVPWQSMPGWFTSRPLLCWQ